MEINTRYEGTLLCMCSSCSADHSLVVVPLFEDSVTEYFGGTFLMWDWILSDYDPWEVETRCQKCEIIFLFVLKKGLISVIFFFFNNEFWRAKYVHHMKY